MATLIHSTKAKERIIVNLDNVCKILRIDSAMDEYTIEFTQVIGRDLIWDYENAEDRDAEFAKLLKMSTDLSRNHNPALYRR